MDVTKAPVLPPNICQMTKLKAIHIRSSISKFTSNDVVITLPDCFGKLELLESVIFEISNFRNIPLSLFNHGNIRELGFVLSNVTLESFVSSSDGGVFDKTNKNYTFDHSYSHNFYLELIQNEEYQSWNFEWNNKKQTVYYLSGMFDS